MKMKKFIVALTTILTFTSFTFVNAFDFSEKDEEVKIETIIEEYNRANKEVLLENQPKDISYILDDSFKDHEAARQRCITHKGEKDIPESMEYNLKIEKIKKDGNYVKVILDNETKSIYPNESEEDISENRQYYILKKDDENWKIANVMNIDKSDLKVIKQIDEDNNIKSMIHGSENENKDITRNSDWVSNEENVKERLDIYDNMGRKDVDKE